MENCKSCITDKSSSGSMSIDLTKDKEQTAFYKCYLKNILNRYKQQNKKINLSLNVFFVFQKLIY